MCTRARAESAGSRETWTLNLLSIGVRAREDRCERHAQRVLLALVSASWRSGRLAVLLCPPTSCGLWLGPEVRAAALGDERGTRSWCWIRSHGDCRSRVVAVIAGMFMGASFVVFAMAATTPLDKSVLGKLGAACGLFFVGMILV